MPPALFLSILGGGRWDLNKYLVLDQAASDSHLTSMKKRAALWMALIIPLLQVGCFKPIPLYPFSPPNGNKQTIGRIYCQTLNKDANDASAQYLTLAIATTMLSASAIIVGAVVGPDTSEGANWVQRNRNTMIVGAGGLLAIPSTVFYFGQNRAANTSATAAKSMAIIDDELAYRTCVTAKADWISSRNQTADALQNEYNKQALDRFNKQLLETLTSRLPKDSLAPPPN